MRALDPDAVGWQEANDPADLDAIRGEMGADYQLVHADVRGVPISVNVRRWEIIDAGHRRMHDGHARTTPARYVTWVVCRHRDTGKVVVFVNTHFVSGAWNTKPKPNKALRKSLWMEHYQHMARILAALAAKYGPVVFGGDFNRVNVDPMHPDAEWADDRGIDKVGTIGPVESGAPVRVETPSDHDARGVDLELVA